jgi:glutamate/tyrosine decarboxylase-like PLP-dependent enzyme
MPLHERRNPIRRTHEAAESLFASDVLAHALPKYQFPEHETIPEFACQAIRDELLLDGRTWLRTAPGHSAAPRATCRRWRRMRIATNKALMAKPKTKIMMSLVELCPVATLPAP